MMSFLGIPSKFSACIVDLIFGIVSCCFRGVLSVLVNLVAANVAPSVFHLFLHVVAVLPHSRALSVLVVLFVGIAANSKAMLAMLRLRYFSSPLSAFFAFLDSGLSSISPDSFVCAESSCVSFLNSMLFTFCACFFLELAVVCGVVLAMILMACRCESCGSYTI